MDIRAAFRDAQTIESARRGFALGDGMGTLGNLHFKYDPDAAGPAKVPPASDRFKALWASLKNAIASSPAKREEMRQEAIFIQNLAQSGEVFGRVNANMRDPVAVKALAKSLDKMIARVPGEQQQGGGGVAAHWSHGLDLALGRLTSVDLSAVKSGLQELMTQPWYDKGENLTSNQRALLASIKEKVDALTPQPRTETSNLMGDPPVQAVTAQVELLNISPSSLPPFPSPLNLSEKGGSVPTSPEMSSVPSPPNTPSPNAPPPPPPPPPSSPLANSPKPGASGGMPDAAGRAQALHDEIGAAKLALKTRTPNAPSPEPGPGPGSTFAEQAVAKLNSGGLRTAAESDKLAKQLAEKSAAKVAEAVKKSPLVTDSPEYKQKVSLLESIQQAGGSPKAAKGAQKGGVIANAESGSASDIKSADTDVR